MWVSLPRLTAGSRERIHHACSRNARGLPGNRRREELAQRVRAHAHGNPCAYLPGYAEKQARGMFPGIAKTDAIDAEVIARTALGVPRALRPAPEEPEGAASLRILSSQREFASSARTRAKNRLRATLLEAC